MFSKKSDKKFTIKRIDYEIRSSKFAGKPVASSIVKETVKEDL